MAEIIDLRYPQDRPLIMGDDDGSAPRLVRAQAYGWGWRKGDVGWVVGTDVYEAIASRVLAPVATATPVAAPTPAAPVVETAPEPEPVPVEPLIFDAAYDEAPSEPAEETYDLDAEPAPAKRGPGRPRKVTV